MGHLESEHFTAILARCETPPAVYIETGLWKGEQLRIASEHFDVCHGVELNDHWHDVATTRVADLDFVHVHRGDTRTWLPRLLAQYATVPCFVKLDAHYCEMKPAIEKSPFPLWDELALLRDREPADVIAVDDTPTFGRERLDLRYDPDVPEWQYVTVESIRQFLGDRFGPCRDIRGGLVVWMKKART